MSLREFRDAVSDCVPPFMRVFGLVSIPVSACRFGRDFKVRHDLNSHVRVLCDRVAIGTVVRAV